MPLERDSNVLSPQQEANLNSIPAIQSDLDILKTQTPLDTIGGYDVATNTPDITTTTMLPGKARTITVAGIRFELTFNVGDLIYRNDDNSGYSRLASGSEINDTITTISTTYSSNKINTEFTRLANTSNTNTGDETTSTIKTKRPLKTIASKTIEGAGNLALVKGDVGLGSVINVDTTNPINIITNADANGALATGYTLADTLNSQVDFNNSSNKYVKIWYVLNSNNALDANSGFSPDRAFKTLAKLNTTLGNTGEQVVWLPIQFTESATFAQLNIEITGSNSTDRAFCGTSGAITSNNGTGGSQTYKNLTLGSFVKTGAGYLRLKEMTFNTAFSDSSLGGIDCYNCTFGDSTTISITGSGTKNFYNQRSGIFNINNALARVNIVTSDYILQFTLTAGTLGIKDAIVYVAQGTIFTIGASGAMFVGNGVQFLYPDNTVAKLNIPVGVAFCLQSCIFDHANSTLNGSDISDLYKRFFGKANINILNLPSSTASTLLATDANKNVVSLAVATYPSLTELSYTKGLTSSAQTQLAAKQTIANKDATGGYAGLTLFNINFKNVLGTITSFFTNSNTVARTYTFQDRNGTIADSADIATRQPINATLTSLSNYNTNGIIMQTASNTFTGRTLQGTAGIAVNNGDGVAGNPSITPTYGTAVNTIAQGNDTRIVNAEQTTNKDATNGYVGLTLFNINFKNVLGTITSFFTNSNTVARTYTFPDRDGTVITTGDSGSITSTMILDGTILNTDINTTANIAGSKLQQAISAPTKAQPANNDTLDVINNKQLGLINTRSSNTPLVIANLVTGGAIGTAVATVDVNSIFLINQTTTGQTLSLPSPTSATLGQIVSVVANSTAGFIMANATIQPSGCQSFVWTGVSWICQNTLAPAYFIASSRVAMAALLSVKVDDFCIRTDTTPLGMFRLTALPASTVTNWKSNITGTLYGEVHYNLSASITGQTLNTPINFNTLLYSIGQTNFITNTSGVLTLQPGFMYVITGMCIHAPSNTIGALGFQWRVNGVLVGTFGGSKSGLGDDAFLGSSSFAKYLFSIAAGAATQNCNLELTGYQNLNIFQGNSNIPSSYISIQAYNL